MNEMPAWLQGLACVCGLSIVIAGIWPHFFRIYEDRRVARNRSRLAEIGLTPEQYMATMSPTDYQSYAEAVLHFWPRRDRHERRDAMFDRLGQRLGPRAAADIRAAKSLANRLTGR